jgi:hypothetical protein
VEPSCVLLSPTFNCVCVLAVVCVILPQRAAPILHAKRLTQLPSFNLYST